MARNKSDQGSGTITIVRQGDGIRPNWYARYKIDGTWKKVDLHVRVKGKPPASLSATDRGDVTFERSRAVAQSKLDELTRQIADGKTPTILKDVASKKMSAKLLSALANEEENRLRKLLRVPEDAPDATPDEREKNARECRLLDEKCDRRRIVYERFAAFGLAHRPIVRNFRQVTTEFIDEYFKDLRGHYSRAVTGRHMHLIETAWKRYASGETESPFVDIPDLLRKYAKDNPSIPRCPLTFVEIARLWKVAKELDEQFDRDFDLYPLSVAAFCTGMRIGDVCCLRWSDVTFDATPYPLIRVKTKKTGANVAIPILEELLDVLKELDRTRDARDEYVFPAAHDRYIRDKDGISKHGKKLWLFRHKCGSVRAA